MYLVYVCFMLIELDLGFSLDDVGLWWEGCGGRAYGGQRACWFS